MTLPENPTQRVRYLRERSGLARLDRKLLAELKSILQEELNLQLSYSDLEETASLLIGYYGVLLRVKELNE